MKRSINPKRMTCGAVLSLALVASGLAVAAAPAQAVCTGAYLAVNTAAQARAKVPTDCTGSSTIRARKNWYYTDATNSLVGVTYGPWISKASLASIAYLPAGRFHKSNAIQSS